MGKYFRIFLAAIIVNIILFFLLGSLGMTNYMDGLVMMIGLIITIQNSFIISLLVYLIDLVRKSKNQEESGKFNL